MTTNNAVLGQYKPYFDNWQANVLGPRPSAELLTKVHGLGLRAGKQALACAMSLRNEGVTGSQIVIACGAPQLNRMRGLIAEGVFKRLPVAANGANHTVYKCEVTPRGEAEIKRLAAMPAASTAAPKAAKRVKKLINDAKAAAGDPKQRAKAKAKPVKASRKANAKPEVKPEVKPASEPLTVPYDESDNPGNGWRAPDTQA